MHIFYFIIGVVVAKIIFTQSKSGVLYRIRYQFERDTVLSTALIILLWPIAITGFGILFLGPYLEEIIEKLK